MIVLVRQNAMGRTQMRPDSYRALTAEKRAAPRLPSMSTRRPKRLSASSVRKAKTVKFVFKCRTPNSVFPAEAQGENAPKFCSGLERDLMHLLDKLLVSLRLEKRLERH
jgi:hypothetical protein